MGTFTLPCDCCGPCCPYCEGQEQAPAWQIAVSGVGESSGTAGCVNINGTFTLVNVGSSGIGQCGDGGARFGSWCDWWVRILGLTPISIPPTPSGETAEVQLTINYPGCWSDNPTYWVLYISLLVPGFQPTFGIYSAAYGIDASQWNCNGPNTLTLLNSPAFCTWPAQLTLTPLPTEGLLPFTTTVRCPSCNPCAVLPAKWKITIAGMQTTCCAQLNGSWTLSLFGVGHCFWYTDTGLTCTGNKLIIHLYFTRETCYVVIRYHHPWDLDGVLGFCSYTYSLDLGSFDCLGTNILTGPTPGCGDQSQDVCGYWNGKTPGTITVEPAP